MLTKMDKLLQLLRRESATTTPALDMCPSTSAAISLSPLRWKAALAVESRGRLVKEGIEFIDQLATSVVGGRDRGAMAKEGICKERLLQIGSVTSRVAISRRVHRYKLALWDRQATRERREEEGGLMPMAWVCHIDAE